MEHFLEQLPNNEKMRIIQEMVPGKQITIAHIIANPDASLYEKLKIVENGKSAIGIVVIDPGETAIIAGDIALKTSGVQLAYMDHLSGTLIVTGTVSEVEAALRALVSYSEEKLGFSVCDITRT